MKNAEITGDQIKAFMDKNDLTLAELANLANVQLNTVWKWTSGRAKPSPLAQDQLRKIMDK